VTTGTNPTTLSGFGIGDGIQNAGGTPSIQTGLDAAKPGSGWSTGRMYVATDTQKIYSDNGSNWTLIATNGAGGTVTSVGLSAPAIFNVANSPVTTSGTMALSLASQTARTFFAGPTSGSATPSFRGMTIADVQSSIFGAFLTGAGCSAGQALTYNSVSDVMTCTSLNITSSQITTGLGFTPISADAGVPSISAGQDTSKPAAGNAGRLYVATDTNKIYRDNGGSWDVVGSSSATDLSAGTISAARLPAFTGDATTSAGSSALTLANSGVTSGTYKSVTVDAKGRVTAASNPTTLSGYGITDSITNAGGTLSIQSGNDGSKPTFGTAGRVYIATDTQKVYYDSSSAWVVVGSNAGSGGTVTSVGLSAPAIFSVSGSPVTASGSLSMSLASQAQNSVFAGPATGGGGAPTFRSLTIGDLQSSVSGAFLTGATCSAGQALTYSSVTDSMSCASLSLTTGQVTTALGFTPVSSVSGTLPSIQSGADASKPGSGWTAGRVYVANDTNKIYLDNGSAWTVIGTTSASDLSVGTLAATRLPAFTGDATSSAGTSALTLANTGVGAGTYKSLTVDSKGRVTAATNPSTLSGYGITDSIWNSGGVVSVGMGDTASKPSPGTGKIYFDTQGSNIYAVDGGGNWILISGTGGGGGGGTVTSITAGTGLTGGTITTSGPIALATSGVTAGTYTKLTVDTYGRATSGATLSASDIPALDWNKITTGTPSTLAGYGITNAVQGTGVPSIASGPDASKPAASVAGRLYVASDTQKIYSDTGAAWVTVGTSAAGGTVTGVTAGTGLSGGTITSSGTLSLATSGVGAGTYNSVTVDTYGRVTAGTNPTTLSGYGITDSVQNVSSTVPSIQAGASGSKPSAGASGRLYLEIDTKKLWRDNGSSWDLIASTVGSDITGTVSAGQMPAFTGDATSSAGSTALTLASAGTAGTYYKVTTDTKGRVTSGAASLVAGDIPNLAWSKITSGTPTTLSGYGITDSISNAGGTPSIQTGLDASKPGSGWTAGRLYFATDTQKIYSDTGVAWSVIATNVGSGGTVTSVALSAPGIFSVSGSPVATTGTLSMSLVSQAANRIFASPNGASGAPSFRSLNIVDLQSIVSGAFLTGSSCSAGQALIYNSTTDTMYCSALTPTSAQVTTALGYTPVSNSSGVPSVQAGLDGSEPAAGTSGRLYVATDSKKIKRDNGTTWDTIATTSASDISAGTLAAARLPAFSGDATSSAGSSALTLANSGVTAGTYTSVTVDGKGRVTAGTSPTTLVGFGITDGVKNAGGTPSIQTGVDASKPSSGWNAGRMYVATDTQKIYSDDGAAWTLIATNGAGGTVTSIGLSAPGIFTVSGSPVTASGTLSMSLASQSTRTVFAAPTGAAGAPTFRSLGISDIQSSVAGSFLTGTGCTAGQALLFNSVTDTMACGSFSVTSSQVTTALGYTPISGATVPSISAGVDASRPAFGTAGRLYIASDSQKIYYDTGSAWVVAGTSSATDLSSGTLPAARLPAFSGDATSSAGSAALALSTTGVGAGTYTSVTVDTKGRVTAATSPTTLAGYGITDGLVRNYGNAPGMQTGADASKPSAGTTGRLYVANDTNKIYYDTGTVWAVVGTGNAADLGAGTLSAARLPAFTGDATSSAGSSALTLANSGVSAGTYGSVTVDAKGRVTAGTSPTSLSGHGITDGVLNAGSAPSMQTGVDAAKPTGGWTAGRIYLANDTKRVYLDTGSGLAIVGLGDAADLIGTLSASRLPAFTGDATSSAGSSALTLANSGVSAGTYTSVTVDAKGRVTSATNPITLVGFGITDAVKNYGGTTGLQEGVFASRPAAGTAGLIYVSTDTKVIYRDNGSSWDGVSATSASDLSSGTLPDARLSANVPLLNAANTWSNTNTFSSGVTFNGNNTFSGNNTYSSGVQSFASASSLQVPSSASAAPTSSGLIAYDSSANQWRIGVNGISSYLAQAAAALTNNNLVMGTGNGGVADSGYSVTTAGTAGVAASNAGTATTLARSDHVHATVHNLQWYFPGIVVAGYQTATAVAPLGISNCTITNAQIAANSSASSNSTYNIVKCTASTSTACSTKTDVYSSNLTLIANTAVANAGGAPTGVTTVSSGDVFQINLATVGTSLADVTVSMSYTCSNN
jgi:phage-related tail fiber protein